MPERAISVPEEIEVQTARLNVTLVHISGALERGNVQQVCAMIAAVEETNQTIRRTLIAAGVQDNVKVDKEPHSDGDE